ncbi:N-acetylglucosamine-6-phosphate deacetylase [uncultured Catenibacterium sp.]|uniref:N-acetylglucosamine-6-phosphate deacetylase n=1 Tax=uncultured Catenibacterium sp. TaxID=286142 RepID=UPI0025ECB030|nr:N-acetylglucosamine-6-phosphate deacetylase [uncultured Catenibacterium sp.]
MKNVIINGKVILEDSIKELNVFFEDGKITEVSDRTPTDESVIDAEGLYVAPGMIDVHTHGRNGSDTMYATFKDLNNISVSELKTGVTSFLPTTMTMPAEDIKKAIAAGYDNKDKVEGAKILGMHLEGPFFSVKYKGAQPEECMIAPTIENYLSFAGEHPDFVKKISLAPEIEGAVDLIKYLTDHNVVVSMGHTDATYDEAVKGIEAGAISGTHTYNAMTPLKHRDPGVVGAVMLHDEVYAELILDGVHVSFPAAKILAKMKGADKLILITDSLEAAMLPDGVYELGNQKVYVKDGQARLKEGNLAGSTANLNQCVRNAYKHLDLPLYEAIGFATKNSADHLGLKDYGRIKEGCVADMIFIDDDININRVILNGETKIGG